MQRTNKKTENNKYWRKKIKFFGILKNNNMKELTKKCMYLCQDDDISEK